MKIKTDYRHILFTATYLLCLFTSIIFDYSTFGNSRGEDTIIKIIYINAAVLTVIKLLMDRFYSVRLFLIMVFIGCMFLIVYINSRYNHLLYMMIIFLGLHYIDDLNDFFKIDFTAKCILINLVIFSSLVGIIENYVTYRTGTTELRYSLGFNHPNTLAGFILSLVLEDSYIRKRRVNISYCIIIWFIAWIVHKITGNRTAVFLMLIYPVLLGAIEKISAGKKISKIMAFILMMSYPTITVFSCLTMQYCRSNIWLQQIDTFLGNRFINARKIYMLDGISLLGQHVQLVSVKEARALHTSIALLDEAYLRVLIQAGPLVISIIAVLYMTCTRIAISNQDRILLLVIEVFLVFGLSESGFNNVFMNFTLLFAGRAIYEFDEKMKLR